MRRGTFTLLLLVMGAVQIGASSLAAAPAPAPAGSSVTVPLATMAVATDSMNETRIVNTGLLDQFGRNVGISGDTAIVGVFDHDHSGLNNPGAAYIYERNLGGADNWGLVKKITASDAQAQDQFGIRVAVSGDTAVVGAFADEFGAGPDSGSAYVFRRDAGGTNNWGEVKKLTASDPDFNDQFGKAVGIDGDTIVVGAVFKEKGTASAVGAAYVYERNLGGTSNWGQVKKLTASDGTASDQFGVAADISGDAIVVGANAEDVGGVNLTGAAYVFERNAGGTDNWGQVKKLVASDRVAGDQFGNAVAIGGDVIVAGAFGHDHGGASNVGSAYVYQRDAGGVGEWGEVKELLASDRQPNDQFGISVAASTVGLAVVGAFADEFGAGPNAGSAYLFDRNASGTDTWDETRKLVASNAGADDWFGWSAAISGSTAIVGAPYNLLNTTSREPGDAYLFDLPGGEGSLKFFISEARSLYELLRPWATRPFATSER